MTTKQGTVTIAQCMEALNAKCKTETAKFDKMRVGNSTSINDLAKQAGTVYGIMDSIAILAKLY